MARKTRLISAPPAKGGNIENGWSQLSGTMGALSPDQGPIGNIPAAPTRDTTFEAPEDLNYDHMIAEREAALGLPAESTPAPYVGPGIRYTETSTQDQNVVFIPPGAPPDLDGLPDRFTLLIERKGDWWKITAPQSHIGLFVAHQDIFVALSDVPGSLAQILRLDGELPAKVTRRRK